MSWRRERGGEEREEQRSWGEIRRRGMRGRVEWRRDR